MIFTPAGVPVLPENIRNIHNPPSCGGTWCVIHKPSPHPLNGAPIWIDEETYAYRLCVHGVRHPDPDSKTYVEERRRKLAAMLRIQVTSPIFKTRPFRHNKKCCGCCT